MEKNICDVIENDEFYKSFLNNKRDPKIAEKLTFADQIQKLSEGLKILSSNLNSQVRGQHGALLSQASHAGRLDRALNTVSGHMDRLQIGSKKLKIINSQYHLVQNQTKVLRQLHDVSHILRLCGNMLQLTNKLRVAKDLNKQARLYFELEPLTEDSILTKIDFIIEERKFVVSSRQCLTNFAQLELLNGLKDRKEVKVMNSVQIFINLQTIGKCVDNLIETFLNEVTYSLKECFAGSDPLTLDSKTGQRENSKSLNHSSILVRGVAVVPSLTTSECFRMKLWRCLGWLISEEIYQYCNQISLLQKCLNKICESSVVFRNEESVLKKFWHRMENLFKTSFTECPSYISQCVQEGLPKLLRIAQELEKKTSNDGTFSNVVFESLKSGYLNKCGQNLKATLATMYYPNTDAVDLLIRTASTELNAAMVDDRLVKYVGAVLNTCNNDFWIKVEANIKLGPDSKQVVDIPNSTQIQNYHMANLVFYHVESVKRMIINLDVDFSKSPTAECILQNLNHGRTLIWIIIKPLIASINTTVGIILLSMHREPGLNDNKQFVGGSSLYMKELHDFLQRCWDLHLNVFNDKEIILKSGRELASHCIDVFVTNMAILKPLSLTGRQRLKNDCNYLEAALNLIIDDVSKLGKPFRLLRAMSALIVQKPEMLVEKEIEREAPIPSYITLFLLFSHGGSDLHSPHTAANWSNERLIQWLDDHKSEHERLELVAGALQKYRASIQRKNRAEYDPVYPLLSDYFERVCKSRFVDL